MIISLCLSEGLAPDSIQKKVVEEENLQPPSCSVKSVYAILYLNRIQLVLRSLSEVGSNPPLPFCGEREKVRGKNIFPSPEKWALWGC